MRWFYSLTRGLKGSRLPLLLGIIVASLALGLGIGLRKAPAERSIGYTELVRLSQVAHAENGGEVASVKVEGERFVAHLRSGEVVTAIVDDRDARHDVISAFTEAGTPVEFDSREPGASSRAVGVLTPLFVIAVVGAGYFAVQKKKGMAHVGAGPATTPVRFADVAGMDEVKEALTETVEFLRDPARFGRLGGRAPRGVLLSGSPGTGKTLLARAVATEAKVPFLSASGSSFQEMYVGVGASRVRSLFKEARRLAPCIVFIDEIDSLGRARSQGGDAAQGDHDQTLNQLLVEMDGFDHASGIVVVASTNRPDVLDPAMVRPGRFDRQVNVPLPDLKGRLEILGVHARPLTLGNDVSLSQVARQTPGFSGAELANLLNEAAILAARENADSVDHAHIERARERIILGAERKGMAVDEEERRATAVHEAGHVAVGVVALHTDPVHKVSILPRGRALGVTHSLPEKDRRLYTRELLLDRICMLLGGRAAELEILGTMTAGAADDIERASDLARKMVAELGMGELGPMCIKESGSPHSQGLQARVEEETQRLLENELRRARHIIVSRRTEIDAMVERLLEEDTLDAESIQSFFPADRRAA